MTDAEIVATLRAEWSNHMDFPADPERNVPVVEYVARGVLGMIA